MASGPSFFTPRACPCGSGVRFERCCGPVLGGSPAPTAEALMRSRYTAYVERHEAHLLASWHPRTRPDGVEFGEAVEWRGLRILDVVGGGPEDDEGVVEFEARLAELGRPEVVHERSRFVRHGDRWRYVDAQDDTPFSV